MRLDALPISFALSLLLSVDHALAVPASQPRDRPSSRGLHVPILRRAATQRNETEWGLWAKQQKELLEGKYSRPSSTTTKRSSGYNLCARAFFCL